MVGGNDDVYKMDVEEEDDDGEDIVIYKTPKGKGRVNQRRNVPESIDSESNEDNDSESKYTERSDSGDNDSESKDTERSDSEDNDSESSVRKSGEHL